MAIRTETCYVPVCDLCGQSTDEDLREIHASSPEDAELLVTESMDGYGGWTLTPDGRLVCDTVDDPAHEAVHEAAGKRPPRPGPDAMTVTHDAARACLAILGLADRPL